MGEALHTLRLMATEAAALQPGGEMLIQRLADLLQAIRSCMAGEPAAQTGWLAALQDTQIDRALLLIHRNPTRAWTVAPLAAEVAMSRSAFAGRLPARRGYVNTASTLLPSGSMTKAA